jgi:hypothetical protein
MANTAVLTIATNIFAAPGEAFTALKERPRLAFPLLLAIVATCATAALYVSSVDLAWLIDRQMQATQTEMTEQQRADTVEALGDISPTLRAVGGSVSAGVGTLLVFAVLALYLTGVSFVTNTGIKFKQWFAFVAWCWLPRILAIAATLVNLFASEARFMPPEALNPLSFGSLLGLDGVGASGLERGLLGLDVTVIWSLVLGIIGYQVWTQRSLTHATAVVLGPIAAVVLLSVLASLF